ncbi:hypothetical protein MRX96_008853 [Rhipicephalus microplus]
MFRNHWDQCLHQRDIRIIRMKLEAPSTHLSDFGPCVTPLTNGPVALPSLEKKDVASGSRTKSHQPRESKNNSRAVISERQSNSFELEAERQGVDVGDGSLRSV